MKIQLHHLLLAGLISLFLSSCQKDIETDIAELRSNTGDELNKAHHSQKY